jgi:hypothetical protein
MNPMYFARGLLSPDGSMRSEQDRQMNLCILQHIPRRCYKNHPNLGGYFYSVDHRFSRAQRALFDGTRGKRAIFLCNEVDTRGRFASARRRHLFPCRFNQKRCCIGSPLPYWDACFDTKQASFFLHLDILKSLVFLTSFTRLLFRLLQKRSF